MKMFEMFKAENARALTDIDIDENNDVECELLNILSDIMSAARWGDDDLVYKWTTTFVKEEISFMTRKLEELGYGIDHANEAGIEIWW